MAAGWVWFLGGTAAAALVAAGLAGYAWRRAAAARRQAEQRYTALLEMTPDAIIGFDPAGRIVLANPQAEALLGFAPGELRRETLAALLPPAAVAGHAELMAQYLRQPEKRQMAARQSLGVRHRSGALLPVEISLCPTPTPAGLIVTAILRDRRDLLQAEAQLRLQSVALEAAANSIVISDRQGIIQWTNPAFTALTGYSAAEAVGQRTSLLKSGHHPPDFYQTLWATITAGQVWQGETVNRRKDGSLYVEEQTIAPVRDAAGAISHFVAIKQDVTPRKQAEAVARERADQLAALNRALQALAALRELPQLWALVLEELQRVVDFDRAGLWLQREGRLECVVGRPSPAAGPAAVGLDPAGGPAPHAEVLRLQAPVRLDEAPARYPALAELGPSWLGVPLLSGGLVIGLLALERSQPAAFTDHHAQLALAFAVQAAGTLENARLYAAAQQEVQERRRAETALRRRNTYLAALTETMLELNQRHGLEDTVTGIVQRACDLLGTPSGFLDLVEPGKPRLSPKVTVGALTESLSLALAPGEGLAGQVWQSGEALVVNDYDAWPGRVDSISRGSLGALVGVPLKRGGRVLGILGLAHAAGSGRTFDTDDLALLSQFAQWAATALENTQLYETAQQELAERRRAQEALARTNLDLEAHLAEITALQGQLREQAMRDPLTGLFNRRYLSETLDRELARAARASLGLSVLLMDVDHFKKLNDTYGHRAGDLMLQALARLLQTNSRSEDIPCRYGGEEFVLVMVGAPLEAARQRAEVWRTAFETLTVDYEAWTLRATLSVGVAAFPRHGTSTDELLKAADRALYQAKARGRNRVVLAEGRPTAPLSAARERQGTE